MKYEFFTEAKAQETEALTTPQSGFSFTSFVPLILIFTVFYFLIIRPQSKKMKEHQEMINNLKIGDKVITSGGIIGAVTAIHEKDNLVEIEIADKVNVKILRSFVSDLVNKEAKKDKVKKDNKK